MKKLLNLFFVCLLFACNSNTIMKKPEDLIDKDLMIQILTETYIAKAAGSEKNINGDKFINYHPIVYHKYNLDSVTFNNSLNYYVSRVNENEDIFQNVSDNLKEQVSKLKKQLKEQGGTEESDTKKETNP